MYNLDASTKMEFTYDYSISITLYNMEHDYLYN